MAHNILPDNLSYGSPSIPSRRTSSRPVAAPLVNSARQRPPPVVVQPSPGQIPQALRTSAPAPTSPYTPRRYHPHASPYAPVEYAPAGYRPPNSGPYHLHGYPPQVGVSAGSHPPFHYSSPQNAGQDSAVSSPDFASDLANISPYLPFSAAPSPAIHSPNLSVPSPSYPDTATQSSPRVVPWNSSLIHAPAPWPSHGYSPQYQPIIQPHPYTPGFDTQPVIQHGGQRAARLSRGNGNELLSSDVQIHGQVPKRSAGQDINIVIEDPKSPTIFREKRVRTKEDSEKQREDSRRLKERGGACVWCYLNKKKCGTKNPCPPCSANGRACFRDSSQLWLFVPLLEASTKKSSRNSKDQTFRRAIDVFRRLQSVSSPQPGATQAIVKIRWHDPHPVNLLVAEISRLTLTDSDAHDKLKNDLVKNSLANIRLPNLENLDSDALESPLIQSAMKMLGLLAAIVTLSRSRIYVRPIDVGLARMTMFFILGIHAKALCEASEQLCTELCDTMRRKASHEHSSAGVRGVRERNPTQLLNPVWVAAALYYRVIVGLSDFAPGPLISEIFVEMKSHLGEVRSKVKHILKNVPPYQGSDKASSRACPIDAFIPEVPVLDYFEIAFWMGSETEFPVSTALARQDAPYVAQPDYWMSCLLDENFGLEMMRQNFSGAVPGPPPVHFRPASEVNDLVPEQETTPSDTTSTCTQPAEQTPPSDGHVDRSNLESYEGQTVVDTVLTDFTWIDEFYPDNPGPAFDSHGSAFDPNAYFGNEDSLGSTFEGNHSDPSSESFLAGTLSGSNELKLSDVTDRSLNFALPT